MHAQHRSLRGRPRQCRAPQRKGSDVQGVRWRPRGPAAASTPPHITAQHSTAQHTVPARGAPAPLRAHLKVRLQQALQLLRAGARHVTPGGWQLRASSAAASDNRLVTHVARQPGQRRSASSCRCMRAAGMQAAAGRGGSWTSRQAACDGSARGVQLAMGLSAGCLAFGHATAAPQRKL